MCVCVILSLNTGFVFLWLGLDKLIFVSKMEIGLILTLSSSG